MTEPTAEQVLEWFVDHLEVAPFALGGIVSRDKHGNTKLALTFVLRQEPRQTYTLDIEGNSYDAACLGQIGGALNAARRLLGKPEMPFEANAFLVEKVQEPPT